ncbi:hypothetical protein ABBQ32_003811 [Trebouxia sp. C0010 RCD-2024]
MSKSCQGSLEDLVRCLRGSDCMQKEGKDVTKCALTVPECQKYREAHVRCKLGQLDARTRIQGNKSY